MASNNYHLPTVSRFCDSTSNPNEILPPIQGYEKKPLVSIDEALKPIQDKVKQLDQMIDMVRHKYVHRSDILSVDEALAIMLYTLEWSEPDMSFYAILNKALRERNRRVLIPWFSYLRLLIHALTKLPKTTPRIMYRAVPENLSEIYQKDEMATWWSFSSCTTSLGVIHTFIDDAEHRTIFNIICNSVVDISAYSFHPEENELLLLPGRQFTIKSSCKAGNNIHIVELEEIEPRYPLLYLPTSQNDDINILLMGETGSGRTTFINAILNYLHYEDFTDACKSNHPLKFLIPFSLCHQNPDMSDNIKIEYGEFDENEAGGCLAETCTRSCRSYVFQFKDRLIRFIDTPPIADTREYPQDKRNYENIIDHISQYQQLHGICLFFRSSKCRMILMDRYVINEILRHLHVNSKDNVFFIFTYAMSNLWGPGLALRIIQKFFSENDANPTSKLQLSRDNVCMTDNEAFKGLAIKKKITIDSELEGSCSRIWEKSSQELCRLISTITKCKPCNVQDLVTLHEHFQQLEILLKFTEHNNLELQEASRHLARVIQKNSLKALNNATVDCIKYLRRHLKESKPHDDYRIAEFDQMIMQQRMMDDLFRKEQQTNEASRSKNATSYNDDATQLKEIMEKVYRLPNHGKSIKQQIEAIQTDRTKRVRQNERKAEMPNESQASTTYKLIQKILNNE